MQHTRTTWSRLDDSQKDLLRAAVPVAAPSRSRIAHGYKQAQDSSLYFNPFHAAPLYPWEIIKDKLRNRPAFHSDVYDHLICEAMSPSKVALKPALLHRGYVFNSPDRSYDIGDEDNLNTRQLLAKYEKLMGKLPPHIQQQYHTISEVKLRYFRARLEFRSVRKIPVSPFHEFYATKLNTVQTLSVPEKNQVIGQMWNAERHKRISTIDPVPRESFLDTKLEMVMDYIFEFGKVRNFTGDWRQWRRLVQGNHHYAQGLYSPYIVRANSTVQLVSEYPNPLLSTWLSIKRKHTE